MFINVINAINYIENIKRKEKRQDLSRMHKALKLLNNPEKNFKVIHISGTNGKGSVCSYISNILKLAGYNIGTFISPYVVKFNERIMYNLEYISDDDLIKYANIIYDIKQKLEQEEDEVITFFEFVTLMGILYFSDKKVDFVVMEVGIGGILDATNVFSRALRLITNVGYDHMNTLGSTLEEIALKKLGIVHNNDTLITTVDESLLPIFNDYTKNLNSKMIWINNDIKDINVSLTGTTFKYKEINFKSSLIGYHQAFNASLAVEAINQLNLNIDNNIINEGLNNTCWKARLEVVYDKPKILLDGAHNIDGVMSLVKSIKLLTNKKIPVLFTALKDKEVHKMISILEEITSEFIFTTLDDTRALKEDELIFNTNVASKIIPSYLDSLNYILDNFKEKDLVLICGSLHFASKVITFFEKMKKN